ncbi:MAG: NAD(P)-dependent oxidoreductase [Cyanobium sp. Prado107]|jgi:3-hydroxyisobutyrate dehydrogenase-like beta-hydroxyacid dehydrogenase|nr:NAD(P)-dependent oxidoreductase [Cyanobium sp. Prado107]
MAANLARAGFELTVHNRTPGPEADLVAAGAVAAESAPAAVAGAGLICLCLSDDAAVQTVLEAVAPSLAGGSLVVDFSTIAPASSQTLAADLARRNVAYIDAPVTGGTEGARAGTLSVLVGGAGTHVERARPLLEVVGQRITHLGPVGAGQQAKAVNQVLVAGSYAAVAEAMALGQRLGLPMDRVRDALTAGAAGSWALEHRAGNMLEGRFPLGFRLALHRKDLAIALESAAATGLEIPLCRLVAAMEDALLEAGHGDDDVSALARWYSAEADSAARPGI